jgi:hypothetical protein
MEMEVDSTLLYDIQKGQVEDEMSEKTKLDTKEEKSPRFMEDNQCVLWYKGRICMPKIKELKDKILREAHESAYSIHPGGNKMYRDLNSTYWWYGMKRDVIKNVALLRRLSESRLSINGLLGCCNPCNYPSRSG